MKRCLTAKCEGSEFSVDNFRRDRQSGYCKDCTKAKNAVRRAAKLRRARPKPEYVVTQIDDQFDRTLTLAEVAGMYLRTNRKPEATCQT